MQLNPPALPSSTATPSSRRSPRTMTNFMPKCLMPAPDNRDPSENHASDRSPKSQKSYYSFSPMKSERSKVPNLVPFSTNLKDDIPDENRSWRCYNIGGYKGMIRHTLLVSKKNKKHLSNVLDIETDYFSTHFTPKNEEGVRYSAYVSEGSEEQFKAFAKFKLNWQASQNPSMAMQKSVPYFAVINNSNARKTRKDVKSNAAFVSSSRDKLDTMRAKVNSSVPDMCRYDVAVNSISKPRIREIVIPKAVLERDKPVVKIDKPFLDPGLEVQPHPKSIPDFSKQLSRTPRTKMNKSESAKEIEKMEEDFQFSYFLRQKYDTNIRRLPQREVDDPKRMPFLGSKLTEISKNLM